MKSEARRAAILKAATDTFLEHGYDRASMSGIAGRLGGSKATLYAYFKSKEELLIAVLREDAGRLADQLLGSFEADGDLEAALARFGERYLRIILAPRTVAMARLLIGQGDAAVARRAYDQGLGLFWGRICGFIGQSMGRGRLRTDDPWAATMHLKGLLGADLVERSLYQADPPAAEDLPRVAATAAAMFIACYGA